MTAEEIKELQKTAKGFSASREQKTPKIPSGSENTLELEKCYNCDRVIGRMETAHFYAGHVVCAACKKNIAEGNEFEKSKSHKAPVAQSHSGNSLWSRFAQMHPARQMMIVLWALIMSIGLLTFLFVPVPLQPEMVNAILIPLSLLLAFLVAVSYVIQVSRRN